MDPKLRQFVLTLLEDDKKKRMQSMRTSHNQILALMSSSDMRRLKDFVATNSVTFEKADYFKLWEALFYDRLSECKACPIARHIISRCALWTADSPYIQRRVCVDFCQLIHRVPDERVYDWMDAFWFILRQEWEKLDRYRIDKFHLFLRMFVAESLNWVRKNQWSDASIEALTSSWSLGPLKLEVVPGETFCSGVGYHLIEVIMEELRETTANSPPLSGEVLVKVMDPFLQAFCHSTDRVLAKKVQDKILTALQLKIPGELEAVAEKLFKEAAKAGRTDTTARIYHAIQTIDSVLDSDGRKANYEAVLSRISFSLPSTEELTVAEMKAVTVQAENPEKKLKRKMAKKLQKQKHEKSTKRVTVFSTRRKITRRITKF